MVRLSQRPDVRERLSHVARQGDDVRANRVNAGLWHRKGQRNKGQNPLSNFTKQSNVTCQQPGKRCSSELMWSSTSIAYPFFWCHTGHLWCFLVGLHLHGVMCLKSINFWKLFKKKKPSLWSCLKNDPYLHRHWKLEMLQYLHLSCYGSVNLLTESGRRRARPGAWRVCKGSSLRNSITVVVEKNLLVRRWFEEITKLSFGFELLSQIKLQNNIRRWTGSCASWSLLTFCS